MQFAALRHMMVVRVIPTTVIFAQIKGANNLFLFIDNIES